MWKRILNCKLLFIDVYIYMYVDEMIINLDILFVSY